MPTATSRLTQSLRPDTAQLPESGIVRVFNHGRNKEGLIPLWVGEGDTPTPPFILDAAHAAMRAGETFYTYQRGIPPLREALARYHQRLYGMPFDAERFYVTGSGMQAIMMAVQLVAGSGDEIVMPTPAWPNFAAAMQVMGARAVSVPMSLANAGWRLDLEALFDAVTPRTRAIFLNSPSNPTGWTATGDELKAVLEFTRRRKLWLIADEVYARFHFEGGLAPSLYGIARPDDQLILVNTFSKNWAMTGWRVGWINAPVALGQAIENLVQYNTSGVAAFMQRAAVVALEDGESFAEGQVARAREGREIVSRALEASPRVRYVRPAGAFYAFFAVEGEPDSMALALRLIDEANIGLAPGVAFGEGGEGYLRLCFLRSPESLKAAMERLSRWLAAR